MIPEEREALTWTVRRRVTILMALMMLVLVVLMLRSWYLQVLHHKHYAELARNNRGRLVVEKPERGMVFDRRGRELAVNVPSFHLAMVLDDVKNLSETVDQVAGLLGVPPEPILKAARKQRSTIPYLPVRVRKDLSLKEVAEVEWAHIPGVVVLAEAERHYIYGEAVGHLLGYVGDVTEAQLVSGDYDEVLPGIRVGQYGAELSFDADLRGVTGNRRIEVDALGFEVRELSRKAPLVGNDVYLSIDIDVQKAAYKALKGRRGSVVAIDPRTGQILAMVSQPGLNPEEISRGVSDKRWKQITTAPGHPMLNRVVQGAYPPGSIFKIPVAAAILEREPGGDPLFCNGGHEFMGRTYRDWKKAGHGWVDIHKSLVESCDVYYYQYGDRLGIDTIAEFAGAFGLGRRTGINLASEHAGLVPTTRWKQETRGEVWFPGETLSAAIGQGYVLATPLQVASLLGTIGTGGKRFVPNIRMGTWERATGSLIVEQPQPLPQPPVASATYHEIKRALRGVVRELHGTGRAADSKRVSIAGKTGTAQVVSIAEDEVEVKDQEDVAYHLRDHAWFAAYAPSDNPVIAVAVLVEHGGHGGRESAPIARQVIESYIEAGGGKLGIDERVEMLIEARKRQGI